MKNSGRWGNRVFAALVPIALFLIYGLPMAAVVTPFLYLSEKWQLVAWAVCSPLFFGLGFVMAAGIISRPFQRAIVAGKFPRSLSHPVYGPRRVYGLCWTAVFYFSPLYHAVLSVPLLKKIVFRIFGYKGSLDITVYPDTWIRDLPVLDVHKGAYLSNKSTIGTNMCLRSGHILVEGIRVDEGGLIGHLAMVGPGVSIGKNADIGVGAAIGIRAIIGEKVRIGPCCPINHGVKIGENTEIGSSTYLGLKADIGPGLKIPGGSNIPAGAIIRTQEELSTYLSSDVRVLHASRETALGLFNELTSGNSMGAVVLNNEGNANKSA